MSSPPVKSPAAKKLKGDDGMEQDEGEGLEDAQDQDLANKMKEQLFIPPKRVMAASESIKIAKPDAHKRTYAFLELENGLKAVVGSDAECDKAGAALCVNVGMCHERKDLPGLAHFLEHMLFTGTTKFPKEGEYHEFIQQNGGFANAYTTCYFTNYMFEVKPEVLDQALDRFSRFFSEPLLTKDCTDREINAVDSEFKGGSLEPWWRFIGIMNMSANPDHPFHVACGNNKVLRDEPKERGVDLYEEMTKLYHSTYSSNGMTLCIIGKESISELTAIVAERFGAVVNKGITMPIGDAVSDKPPFLPADWHRLVLQNPVKDVKELTFAWVLPYQAPLWKNKPTRYVSHLLGYEGSGSVIAELKSQGLITGCSAGDGAWLEGAFSLLNVSFDLTDAGLSHIKEIGEHLFAFIALLQKTPVEKWIFDEMQKLAAIQFKFGEDHGPFDLCPDIAMSLQTHPPSEALAGGVLIYEYDPASISSVISQLTLGSVRVSHQAKCLADRCTEKDTSYDSPMAFLPIEAEWLSAWSLAVNPGSGSVEDAVKAAADKGLHMPKPNPFIPEDLSLRELPSNPPAVPVMLPMPADSPVACTLHRQDDMFGQPKGHVVFHIYSPFVIQDIESWVKTELWCSAVQEALQEYAYDAEVAGVSYALVLRSGYINLVLAGFNDKLGVLLDAVTEKMCSMIEVPENIYSIVADGYSDMISNMAFHSQPYSQCGMRFNELATRGSSFPSYKRFEVFKTLSRESLTGLAAKLFTPCHVEAMVLGNFAPAEAQTLAAALAKGLHLEKKLQELPERAEAALPSGPTVWNLDATDVEDPNHAVFVRIQLPESMEDDMHMAMLAKVLSAKFFEILRTQQQLGYIVNLASSSSGLFTYLAAVVQTEYAPDFTRSRIDAFLDEHFVFVEEKLEEEEFLVCRDGTLSELKMRPKNLAEESGRYSKHFSERTYDFGRRQRAIAFLESSCTLETLRNFVREKVRSAPRLYTQVKKRLETEDKPLPEGATVPSDPADLRKWNTHVETVEKFKLSATWRSFNSSVEVTSPAKL